jgi:hypothetical protein
MLARAHALATGGPHTHNVATKKVRRKDAWQCVGLATVGVGVGRAPLQLAVCSTSAFGASYLENLLERMILSDELGKCLIGCLWLLARAEKLR